MKRFELTYGNATGLDVKHGSDNLTSVINRVARLGRLNIAVHYLKIVCTIDTGERHELVHFGSDRDFYVVKMCYGIDDGEELTGDTFAELAPEIVDFLELFNEPA